MLFSSATFFFLFLPSILLIYFITPRLLKNLVLLAGSLIFYMFSSINFGFMLLGSISVNYIIAYWVNECSGRLKKGVFISGLFFNLGILIYFKYLSFFLKELVNPPLTIMSLPTFRVPVVLIPLALSFYTFHAISYLTDVYLNRIKPEKNPIDLAVYFLLFPHLIAGPIVRFREIASQIKNHLYKLENFSYGVARFIVGLAKKVMIADTLAPVADEVFNIPPGSMTTLTAWLGVVAFMFQIYFDFSGYSDMAIGLAAMFGFTLPENFNFPYISTSLTEFWRRWHMTLSSWFRDYLYYPLARSFGRTSKLKLYISIFITFVLIGLWHGANWTFVIFGAVQGMVLIIESFQNGVVINWMPKMVRHGYFILVIVVSWVFFRSENLDSAFLMIKRLFWDFSPPTLEYRPFGYFWNQELLVTLTVAVILSTPFLKWLLAKVGLISNSIYQLGKMAYLVTILYLCVLYIAIQTFQTFLYFKF